MPLSDRTKTPVLISASTMYLDMAVLIGGGGESESQTKSFSKDCIIYAINTDPSPRVMVVLEEISFNCGSTGFNNLHGKFPADSITDSIVCHLRGDFS